MRNYYVPCLRYRHRYDYLASSAAANTMTVFVAALEVAKFLITIVSDTGTVTIILPQAPLQIIY
jgi:hypothetical protein